MLVTMGGLLAFQGFQAVKNRECFSRGIHLYVVWAQLNGMVLIICAGVIIILGVMMIDYRSRGNCLA